MQLYVLVIEGPPGKLAAMWLPVQLLVLLGEAGTPGDFVILVVLLIVGPQGQLYVLVVEESPGSIAAGSARRPRMSSSFSAWSGEQISDRVGVLGVVGVVRRPCYRGAVVQLYVLVIEGRPGIGCVAACSALRPLGRGRAAGVACCPRQPCHRRL